MKMKILLLFIFGVLLVGCTTPEPVVFESTTATLTSTHVVEQPAPPRTVPILVQLENAQTIFVPANVNAVIEFSNDLDTRERLVIPELNIDYILAPNQRVTVKLNSEPHIYELAFANDLRQIVVG